MLSFVYKCWGFKVFVYCREIDACEPYVKYANGSVISFPVTCFYEIDAQAVVTGTTVLRIWSR